MPSAILNLIKGDKAGSETDYRDALSVNMHTVVKPIFGVDGYMQQSYGLRKYADGAGVGRGGVYNDRFGEMYRVSGTELESISADGTVTKLGAISGGDLVSMPYSFNTQGIVANGRFYLYDASNGFREVTDPELGNPIDAVWVDGYYFFTDGEFIYHTDITDESSIDPLKFATAEFQPDETLGVAKTQDNKVMVFGRYSIEYFANAATDDFAFQRLPTRAIKVGIVGPHCKAEMGGKWYILGNRKEEAVGVHIVTVGQSQHVSSREVEKVINEYTDSELRQAKIEAYEQENQTYVVVHLPNHVLQFNEGVASKGGIDAAWTILATGERSERPWRAWHLAYDPRLARWTVGDKEAPIVGTIERDEALQYGEMAEWYLFTPYTDIETASIDEVSIETVPGFTTEKDATVFLSMTYQGVTWGKEWTLQYGLPGAYSNRFIARRLGYVSDTFALRMRGVTRSRVAFSRAVIKYG